MNDSLEYSSYPWGAPEKIPQKPNGSGGPEDIIRIPSRREPYVIEHKLSGYGELSTRLGTNLGTSKGSNLGRS